MPLNRPPEGHLEALLALQGFDTDLDRCRHRRATLPERGEMVAIEAHLVALDQDLAVARAARDAVAGDQERLEQTLSVVEHRAADIKRRLYGGMVSATRELQAMSAELDSLTARASELESRVLEKMEDQEPLDARVAILEREKGSQLAAHATLEQALVAREAEVDAEVGVVNAARAEAAVGIPPDLVATYEQLRRRLGGVGVARLVGSLCGGCYLTLPATELERLRHQSPGTLSFCDQCGRILVPSYR